MLLVFQILVLKRLSLHYLKLPVKKYTLRQRCAGSVNPQSISSDLGQFFKYEGGSGEGGGEMGGGNRWGENSILCHSFYKQPDFADGKIDLEKVQFINTTEVRLQ